MRPSISDSIRFPILFLTLLMTLQLGCGRKAARVTPPVQTPPSRAPAGKPSSPTPAPSKPAPSRPAPEKPGPGNKTEVKPVVPPPVPANPNHRGPMIRVALTAPSDAIRISAGGQYYLIEKAPETERRLILGEIQVRLERPQTEAGEVWRIQVASLANADAAATLARQLGEQFALPSVVRENAAAGTSQVRIGRFATRGEAQDFAAGALADAGYRDAFVVREAGESARGTPVLALRGPDGLFRTSRSGYLFLPGGEGSFLRLNNQPYRGTLDIILDNNNRLLVVNELGIEDYLQGVIPAELSPVTYPETEALAAQAIAARTYALKNLGRFRASGYDLTDDTRTQVYKGTSIEKEGSNRAVRETAGIAIYYNGSLIDALYTSTCGGRTEDFANVFDTAPVPYLQSVVCAAEISAGEMPGATLSGYHSLADVLFVDDGSPANRELELARVLGLTRGDPLTRDFLEGIPDAAEIRGWLDRSLNLAGRKSSSDTAAEAVPASRAGFIRYAALRFFGRDEIERRVSDSDVAYYTSNFRDGAAIPAAARPALAYLAQRKLWQPYPDNSVRPEQPVLRGDALALLVRWILSARPQVLKTGVAADPGIGAGGNAKELPVKRGNRAERLRLASDLRLFKTTAGRSMPVAELRVIGNEKLTFHQATDGEIDFLEVELSASGASSDRFSPTATWHVTIARAVVAEKLRSLAGNIGEIQDLKPARLGNSGRVVQLEVIGSRSSVVLNGYRVRSALGLNDTLYTLERTPGDDGRISSFTFDGRGWGHGIGLCQTGAVGMARAGRSAEEILKTYYQGVELRQAYDRE